MEGLERILEEHHFLDGMDADLRSVMSGCARNVRFEAGSYLFREGESADEFYLIRHGRVALEISAPDRGTLTFETLREGEVAGVSSLLPPYRWAYDAQARSLTRAIAIDATCLRRKCEEDHDLGSHVMMRFVPILVERLHATQLQLLDVYGTLP